MKNKYIFLTVILLITNLTFSQTASQKVDSILSSLTKRYPEIGISVGIINNDKEHYSTIGKLDRDGDRAINKHSVFEIASITKAITGNLIAQAIIDKKINSNDYIDNYLPAQFKLREALKNKIKITDLASHQSGLPDINFPELIAANPQQPVSSINKHTIVSIVNNCDKLSDYGQYRYATLGYILLGQILENVYQQKYCELVNKKVINPLQIERTYTKEFAVDNITSAYNPDGGLQELFNWNITAPAGLIKSSSADMITYLKAILSTKNNIGKAAKIAENTFYKDTKREIGLGINIIRDEMTVTYAKTGDTMGQSSIMAYNKDKNWGIIILMNQRDSKLRNELFNKIYEILQQ